MPAALSYPGVYLFEVPPTVRPIAQVATSIAVFIDFFAQGPMNKAVEIFGIADFERVFGGLDRRSEASYAISQFFLNHGSQAYVIRVASSDATHPLVAAAAHIADAPGGSETTQLRAANEGVWGNNVRFSVEPNANPGTFNLVVTRYVDITAKKLQVLASERFLNLSASPTGPRFYAIVLKDQSSLVQHDPTFTPGPNMPAPVGTLGGHITTALASLNGKSFTFQTNTIASVTLVLPSGPPAFTDLVQVRAAVENLIRTKLPTVAVDLLGDRLWIRNTRRDPKFDWTDILQVTSTELALDAASGKTENVQEYVLGFDGAAHEAQLAGAPGDKGADGVEPDATGINSNRSAKTGLYALEDVDLFNIVCVPRAAKLATTEMLQVYSEVISYCEERRAFVIIDPPEDVAHASDPVQSAKDFLDANNGLRSKNAAFYFPLVDIPDPLDEFRLKEVGVSGTMAGIYARTDAERGVWKAPAGVEAVLRGVAQLDVKLTDLQNGALNPVAINCLRTFPVYGPLSWGARTLDGADVQASQWKYIPIRRLALLIEESLYRGTKWVVFEPNDEPLWAKIRLNVGNFMMGLFRQGAFQGDTPSKAFFVKCDGETTTANDRSLGIVNIEVGFAPLKPAEFVVIKIQQIPDVD
jgi:phage tail sheath protein FI